MKIILIECCTCENNLAQLLLLSLHKRPFFRNPHLMFWFVIKKKQRWQELSSKQCEQPVRHGLSRTCRHRLHRPQLVPALRSGATVIIMPTVVTVTGIQTSCDLLWFHLVGEWERCWEGETAALNMENPSFDDFLGTGRLFPALSSQVSWTTVSDIFVDDFVFSSYIGDSCPWKHIETFWSRGPRFFVFASAGTRCQA